MTKKAVGVALTTVIMRRNMTSRRINTRRIRSNRRWRM
jgi:hypothetical protein